MSKLRNYASNLPEQAQSNFKKTYGKLLGLLDVKVQAGAITVLGQNYDSKLRCFTFSNFQLAPNLEEFALINGQPLTGKPNHYCGNYPASEKVIKTLGISSEWLTHTKTIGMTPEGIPRVWSEDLINKLIEGKRWEIVAHVLALAIYDLILFPRNGDVVSATASDVFMARKCRGESSTFPILADLYHTLHHCHKLNGIRTECFLPILYVWLAAHVLERKNQSFCLVSKLTDMAVVHEQPTTHIVPEDNIRFFFHLAHGIGAEYGAHLLRLGMWSFPLDIYGP